MFRSRSVWLVVIFTLVAVNGFPGLVSADDGAGVPMFRGNPEHTGEMPGPGPVGMPEVLWRFETDGAIASSPAVIDGVVYITSGSGDGNLYAINGATGAERWRFQINFREYPVPATSSPAVDGGVVYVGSSDGFLYALDVDSGAALWRWETDGPGGGSRLESSPVVVDGVVYVTTLDVALRTTLVAIDTDSRSAVWASEVPTTFQTSPAVAGGLLYGGGFSEVWARDAVTGEVRWSSEDASIGPAAPAVSGGLVYFAGDDAGIVALDAAKGRPEWVHDTGAAALSSPAVADGLVYVSTRQDLIALDAITGAVQWQALLASTGAERTGEIVSSPAVADGVVYVASDAGIVYAFDAVSGEERWRVDLGAPISSSPAVIDGRVYVGDENGVLSAIGNP